MGGIFGGGAGGGIDQTARDAAAAAQATANAADVDQVARDAAAAAQATANAAATNTEGAYTPTGYAWDNITSVTAMALHYQRIGNIVHVFGTVQAQHTTAGVFTGFQLSLPVASNFTAGGDLSGTAVGRRTAGSNVAVPVNIAADPTNDRAWLTMTAPGVAANAYYDISFSYKVK